MRAIEVSSHGGPEVLRPTELGRPSPGPGEVQIRTTAIGVNFIDTYFREGIYPIDLPYIPGSEGAGIIEAIGPTEEGGSGSELSDTSTSRFAIGDRVAWCQVPGSYAQYVAAPQSALVSVDNEIPDSVAASILLQGITADYLITDCHRAVPDDWVLITAGAGGVGQLLIQMAVARGYSVITTTSTPEKADICRSLGAHHVLSYEDATSEHIRELSAGGVTTAFDGVGRATFDTSLASLRPRGYLVLFGAASGPVPAVDPQRLNAAGSVFLTRPTLGNYIATEHEFRTRAERVLGSVADGSLKLQVGSHFGLSEAAKAHGALQSRGTVGSIVLDPSR